MLRKREIRSLHTPSPFSIILISFLFKVAYTSKSSLYHAFYIEKITSGYNLEASGKEPYSATIQSNGL